MPNSYLNELRLNEWRDLTADLLPGAAIHLRSGPESDASALSDLRMQGHLSDYSDDELLTVSIDIVWVKPTTRATHNDVSDRAIGEAAT